MLSRFKDRKGRTISITAERVAHICRHKEMQSRLHEIELTITQPDFVEEDLYRLEVWYYYRYLKQDRKYLMVVVKFQENQGEIKTAYLVEK